MKKICVVTGSRSEYGLLRWVMQGIKDSDVLELQVIVTGTHLSPAFGLTYVDIETDGFAIDRRVEMLLGSDTPLAITKSMGQALCGFAEALVALNPDILLLLGDRFEILVAATAATIARVPIAHLHGGESTEGAIDEAIRHSVTKMSHLHFVAAEAYRRRVIQLGERPDRVFLAGGLGIDNILKLDLLDRESLETALKFRLGPKSLLVTFHPVTLESATSATQVKELLAALECFGDTHLIFTLPNADPDNQVVASLINEFVERHHTTARAFTSLGQVRYLSALRHVDGVVGNSSSGLIEAPSFKKGTVNIGDRQRGRLKASSVIDCAPDRDAIQQAIARLFAKDFKSTLASTENPYGAGGASKTVVSVLEQVQFDDLLKKRFYDQDAK